MKILISTLWEGNSVPFVINNKKPDEIFFLMDDHKTRQESFKKIKSLFKAISIQEIKVNVYDMVEMTREVSKKIDSISEEDEVFICISEAMKPMSLSLMYASYLYSDKVEGIYYVMQETGEIIKYPLLDLNLKNGRKEVLKIINKLSGDKQGIKRSDIVEKAKGILQKSACYENLNELIRMGFVNKEDNRLTMFGKISLLR